MLKTIPSWLRSLMRAPVALAALGAASLLAIAPAPLGAQGYRDLYWQALDVTAHLDSAGHLRVRERQDMVFTGDWNGGERTFNVRLGQHLDLHRVARVDSGTGREVELSTGPLDLVDQYEFKGATVRWRSRLPSDPPFLNAARTYVIDYTLGNILRPGDSTFTLDNDFAFTDRYGTIVRYTLHLTLDPAWEIPSGFTGEFVRDSLEPGTGFVVTLPLRFRAAGRPSAVTYGVARDVRLALLAILGFGVVVLGALLVIREARLGRFASPPSTDEVNATWLEQHVLNMLPEAVGAAWDGRTAAPEVAAVLARLVQEKKLASEVKSTRIWIFTNDVMHLRLLVPRKEFKGHERELVDALFLPHADVTDTSAVRERYRKTGFNPAATIEKYMHEVVGDPNKADPDAPKPSRVPTLVLLGLAVVLWGLGFREDSRSAVFAAPGLGVSIVAWIIAASQAHAWRSRSDNLGRHALRFVLPLAALVGALGYAIVKDPARLQLYTMAALVALVLAVVNSTFNSARSLQGAHRIAMRKRLLTARRWFLRELQQPSPRLNDDWFPWLIAFGLGPRVDKWFKAFGGVASSSITRSSTGFGSSSSSSSSGSAWTGMGGGGGFSGGGSSGSWAAAAGVMGSSISKPSSGSSGGGGGGGGSSGGGGGGGW